MDRVKQISTDITYDRRTGAEHVAEREIDVTRDVVELELHGRLRAELTRPARPTLDELAARVEALTRLVIGADLLDEPGPARR